VGFTIADDASVLDPQNPIGGPPHLGVAIIDAKRTHVSFRRPGKGVS